VLIRDARPEDAAAIARLLEQLGYSTDVAAVPVRLRSLQATGDRLLVAQAGENVVGLAQLHSSASLEHDGPTGKLAALVVDENARQAGVGRRLVAAVEAEARARGCVLLFLTTAERRAEAHAFYERTGFEHTGRRYTKRLG
jgi:N-acetylglutamate synthase-like GNAT family acetyltransferase